MKKQLCTFLATAAAIGAFPIVTHAAYPIPSYVDVVLNGEKVDFPDVQPYVDATGRTLVPVRFVSESMGGKVGWEASTQTVDIQWKGKDIRLQVGHNTATVDQVAQTLDTAVTIHDGRTFVPLRFVSETMGATVKWDQSADTVQITTADFTPDPNAKYDAYGRLIRTTNLPSNAKDYTYILADIPNGLYEMPYCADFTATSSDSQVSKTTFSQTPEFKKQNIDLWMGRVRGYFDTLLNVDYKNIDYSFADKLYGNKNPAVYTVPDMRRYVDWVKQNQIQIEGYVDPEPSTIYYGGFAGWYVRSKYKFYIKHFNKNQNIIYDAYLTHIKQPLQTGVWYEGYMDVPLATNVSGDWGSTLAVDEYIIF